jgi:prepilin-type N-terminal cleavage/methylation domain-containing protein
MQRKTNKPKQGFTIIEVMIVLAIAGLILLIVFLAVPALQRNARNTQRKADVAALLAAYSEFVTNNNGTQPATCSGTSSVVMGNTQPTSTANVGYFNQGCSQTGAMPAGGASKVFLLTGYANGGGFSTAAKDMVVLDPGANCAAGGVTSAGAGRAIVALYEIETGPGTYGPVCQQS